MGNRDTYYERVPVALVKKIAKMDPVEEQEGEAAVVGVTPAVGDAPASRAWEELAARAQQETDPKKMIDLVQQLIASYDEEKMRSKRGLAAKPRVTIPVL